MYLYELSHGELITEPVTFSAAGLPSIYRFQVAVVPSVCSTMSIVYQRFSSIPDGSVTAVFISFIPDVLISKNLLPVLWI